MVDHRELAVIIKAMIKIDFDRFIITPIIFEGILGGDISFRSSDLITFDFLGCNLKRDLIFNAIKESIFSLIADNFGVLRSGSTSITEIKIKILPTAQSRPKLLIIFASAIVSDINPAEVVRAERKQGIPNFLRERLIHSWLFLPLACSR